MAVLAWNQLLLFSILIGHLQAAPREVNGNVGGSVLLSLLVPHGQQVTDVRWKSGPGKARLGDSKGRNFEQYDQIHSNYSSMVKRIVMHNATALRLTNLTMEDSGIFKAEITLNDGNSEDQEFQLNVYDPVPVPFIEYESFVNTSDGCNITLACQIPFEQDVSFTWAVVMSRTGAGEATEYQHIANGTKLQLSLKTHVSSYLDQEYICFVRNPADHKYAFISKVCPRHELLASRVNGYFFIPAVLILLATLGLCIYLQMRKKKKKRKDEANREVYCLAEHEQCPPTTTYAQIKRRPPDGNDEAAYCLEIEQERNMKPTTIYDELKAPPDRHTCNGLIDVY